MNRTPKAPYIEDRKYLEAMAYGEVLSARSVGRRVKRETHWARGALVRLEHAGLVRVVSKDHGTARYERTGDWKS